jgi:hypothetical protein
MFTYAFKSLLSKERFLSNRIRSTHVFFFCFIFSLFLINSIVAQEVSDLESDEEQISQGDEYFTGVTPFSSSVWNAVRMDVKLESGLRNYVFREAYLIEADRRMFSREGRMFMVPLDDLASTQARTLSPLRREAEERMRRDYAETVSSIVINKGVPEYVFQMLGLYKLKEGLRKIEKMVSLDVAVTATSAQAPGVEGSAAIVVPNLKPWRLKGDFLSTQKSYKMSFTNTIWSLDLQGGYTSNKNDRLLARLSARWGRYYQDNSYYILTDLFVSSFSMFFKEDLSIGYSVSKKTDEALNKTNTLYQGVGLAYVF